jgi:hypothetical protein
LSIRITSKKGKSITLILLFLVLNLLSLLLLFNNDYYNSDNVIDNLSNNDNFFDDYSSFKTSSTGNWWNSSYKYRLPINITNLHTTTLPNGYSVNLSVDTASLNSSGKLRVDGKDLRIAWYNSSSGGWVELDRINETNFNTADTQIWFKTQTSINAGASDTNYYAYYGNLTADNPPTNRSYVYDFFDDFTQADGDAIGWTETVGTQWTVLNNEYLDPELVADRRTVLDTYTVENASIEVRIKQVGPNNFGAGVMYRYSDPTHYYTGGLGYWADDATFAWANGGAFPSRINGVGDESGLVNNSWQYLRIDIVGDHHLIYMDDIEQLDETNATFLNAGQIGFMTYGGNSEIYYDDLKIRLLVPTEPSLILGTEEIDRPLFFDFKYYKEITIDNTKVNGSGAHKDFPVLISCFDSDLHDDVQPDGDDIAFSNGTAWLDHEIELFNQTYNTTHAQLVAWVRIPSLSTSIDTTITMYYGNSTMDYNENPYGVWDSNYVGIWHLNDLTTSTVEDSTLYNNDGTKGAPNQPIEADAKFGKGQNVTPTTEYIQVGTTDMSNISGTVELWARADGFLGAAAGNYLFGHTTQPTYNNRTQLYIDDIDGNLDLGLGDSHSTRTDIQDLDTDTWYHIVLTWNGTDYIVYVDSILKANGTYTAFDGFYSFADIANNGNPSARDEAWNGTIDEVRFSNIVRSADWIATEYNNQYEPNSFYSIGNSYEVGPPNTNYFSYYKDITIDHTKIYGSGSLTNFPVLISIFDSDLHDDVQPDGDDIAFGDSNAWLDHEIELFNQTYNTSHALLVAWVRIPRLSSSMNIIIRMYYGNPSMASRQNSTGVWDSNYKGVWHLKEDPGDPPPQFQDSTLINNGTAYNLTSANQIDGKIDGGLVFDDSNERCVNVSHHTSLQLASDMTISAWVKTSNSDPNVNLIINKWGSATNRNYWLGKLNGNELAFFVDDTQNVRTSMSFINDSLWHYVVGVADASNNLLRIYVDGIQRNTNAYSGTSETGTSDLNIGRGSGSTQQEWDGEIDEAHVSNMVRSADWISTEFNNQDDPNSFYSVGSSKEVPETPLEAENFKYYKEITILNTMVAGSGSHDNFSVLISILDSDLRNEVQPDGDDIAFSIGTEWLDYEIELFNQTYNNTHAQLVVWVRVPSLSTSIDTNIKMYFGNSTMSRQENPTEVWDSNYKGVWHLSENPAGGAPQIKDSTSPYSNGTTSGMISTDQVAGQIDGSLEFDGNDEYVNFGNPTELQITGAMTVEAWFRATDIGNTYLISKNGPSGQRGWDLSFDAVNVTHGSVMFRYCLNGNGHIDTVGEVNVTIGEWHHVVGVFNPSTYARFFLNGQLVDENTTNILSSQYNATNTVDFGTRSDLTNYYNGTIDEVRISNSARSADWILTEYNNQHDPSSFYSVGYTIQLNDVIDPIITINLPTPDQLCNKIAPSFNVYVNETNLHKMWYTLDSGLTNTTFTSNGTINQTEWDKLSNGTVTIVFYTNDTSGNMDSASVTVRIDILAPSITINNPQDWDLFGQSAPSFNVFVNNSDDTMWYTLDGGLINITFTLNGTINQTEWDKLSNGTVTIVFYANDTAGNIGSASVTVRIDILAPSITINNPLDWDLFGLIAPSFNVFVNNSDDTMWYSLDGGLINITFTLNGTINQTEWDKLSNGTVTIVFYANDTMGNIGSVSVTVRIDILAPSITINNPQDWDLFGLTAPPFNVFVNNSDDTMWYTLDGGLINITFTLNGTINPTEWAKLANGTHTIIFYANDSVGNEGSDSILVRKDIYLPSIQINSPTPGQLCSGIAPSFNVFVNNSDDTMWYTLDSGLINITFTLNGTINQTEWDKLSNGTITITFYCNDTLSRIGSTSVTVWIDIIAPSITINNPQDWDLFGLTAPPFNVFVNNSDDTMWYTLDGGLINITFTLNGTINPTEWAKLANGTHTIIFYANDSVGNEGSDSILIRKDIYMPSVLINSPTPGQLCNGIAPSFNVFVNNSDDTMWYTLDGGLINITFTSNGTINQTEWDKLSNGTITITFYCNDTLSRIGSTSVTVWIDIIAPLITINNPQDWDLFGLTAPPFNVFVNNSDDTMWYTLDSGLINITFASNGTINQTEWDKLSNGTVTIVFYANDTAGNIGSASVTVRIDVFAPSITINSPTPGQLCNGIAPSFNVFVNNSDDTMWYTLEGGLINITFTLNGTINQTEWAKLSNGTVTITFYCNDTLGRIASASVTVWIDIIAPSITINNPQDWDLFGLTAPTFNVFVNNSDDTMWYTLDGGLINITFASNGTINPTEWAKLTNGTHTIIFYANDSVGNEGSNSILVRKDIYMPSIQINSPTPGQLCNGIAPAFNVFVNNSDDTMWYTLDGGLINITFTSNGTINQTEWTKLSNGTNTITFYCNDTLGRISSASVTVWKDIIAPAIIINTPQDWDLFGLTAPPFNVYINDSNLHKMWYSLDGGLINITFTSNGTLNQTEWVKLANGTHTIIFYANDTLGNEGSNSVLVRKDIYMPSIQINSPTPGQYCNGTGPYFSVFANNSDDTMWYTLDGGLINITFTSNGTINQTEWAKLSNGTVTITFYCNDTSGRIASASVMVWIDIIAPYIMINFPNPSQFFNSTSPPFNVYINDINLHKMWYTIDGGVINITFVQNGTIDQTEWDKYLISGSVTIIFYANDTVGNTNSSQVIIEKDIDGPITNIQYIILIVPNFVNDTTQISFISNDGTGCGVDDTYYQIDGGGWTNYSTPFTLNGYGEGNHTVEYYSSDNINNNETVKSEKIYLDINAPTTTLLFTSLFTTDYVNSSTLFNLSADDGTGSGINSRAYQIDGGAWTAYTVPFNLGGIGEGPHWICYNSTDNIDNIEVLHNKTVYLYNETTAPTTTFVFDPVTSPNIVYPSTPISLTADDGSGAGVAVIWYRIDSDGWKVYSAPFTLEGKAEGNHEIRYYSIDNVGNNETFNSYILNLKFTAEQPPEEPPILLIILIIIIGALVAALALVGVKKSKGGKTPKTYVKEVKVKKSKYESTSLKHKREQLVKDAKISEKSGDFASAAELYGQSKEISNELFKLGIDGEAEKAKVFANLESESLASIVEYKLTNSCINGLMTQHGNFAGLIYYTEPKIYPDKKICADGLILNDSKFLQARLTIPDDAQELAEELAIDPENVEHIKAIQFIYTSDLSEQNIVDLIIALQTIDLMVFIVGLIWPKFQYEQTINLPQDSRIEYPENIRIINYEIFADLVAIEGKFRVKYDKIIDLHQSSDANALKKILDSFKDLPHTTIDLKENLRQKGLLQKDFDDYFYF